MAIELKVIKPIESFIIAQKDITPIQTENGAYYHYSQVCTMLNRLKEQIETKKDRQVCTNCGGHGTTDYGYCQDCNGDGYL